MSSKSGELFILSAPSGAGKTTLIRRLFASRPYLTEKLAFSVSYTTRPQRSGEAEGKDYYFVGHRAFEELIAGNAFLEWAVVHGHLYGTGRREIEALLGSGSDVILDIDVQGARQVREHSPQVPAIFILPPSYRVLEERLRRRGLDRPADIERRLRNAAEEMRCYKDYDYVILNDDLDRASEALAAVFLARRSRRDRMQSQVERILEGFPPSTRSASSAAGERAARVGRG